MAVVVGPKRPPRHRRVIQCRYCNTPGSDTSNIFEDAHTGFVVCTNCGVCIETIVDERTEWRTFSDSAGDDPSRVGGAMSASADEGAQMYTLIQGDRASSRLARELVRTQLAGIKKEERQSSEAERAIDGVCERARLSARVANEAKKLHRRYHAAMRGAATVAVVAAFVHVAMKIAGEARTFQETEKMTGVPKTNIGKAVNKLHQIMRSDGNASKINAPGLHQKMTRFCSLLGFEQQRVVELCEHVAMASREDGCAKSTSPLSVAAAAIYFVAHLIGRPVDLARIARVVGVVEATARNAYRDMARNRYELIPETHEAHASLHLLP